MTFACRKAPIPELAAQIMNLELLVLYLIIPVSLEIWSLSPGEILIYELGVRSGVRSLFISLISLISLALLTGLCHKRLLYILRWLQALLNIAHE
jgi:hypothetical protein